MTKSFLSTVLITGLMSAQTVFATVPTLAMTFDTNVTPIGTTSSQEAKIQAAEMKIKDVVGSEEFRSAVLNHTYGGKKTFVDNHLRFCRSFRLKSCAFLRYPQNPILYFSFI